MTAREIRARAREVLQRAKITGPRIPVEKLPKILGAELVYSPCADDISGVLIRSDDQVVIGVNSNHPVTRQRFTIAHEIGHLVLHADSLETQHYDRRPMRVKFRDLRSAMATDPHEIEANKFASELLVPHDVLKKYVRGDIDLEDDGELIMQLAKKFDVSSQAMTIRLAEFRFSLANARRRPRKIR